MTPNDDIIIDRVQIIGTRHIVWKAWKFWETNNGPSYHTITHFGGTTYGRMGTEEFRCPPMPDDLKAVALQAGRLDKMIHPVGGELVSREWYLDQLAAHKVTTKRTAHFAILSKMSNADLAKPLTFDDNGTITMEE